MEKDNLLLINSSGRLSGSVTRKLSSITTQLLQDKNSTKVINRELTKGLPFINEDWIGATFTSIDQRTEDQHKTLSFSGELVNELEQADTIIIASPIYNFSIPAVLRHG